MRSKLVLLAAIGLAPMCVGAQELAREKAIGNLEVVATFNGPMPTGVAVSNDGRVFVNFPRWGTREGVPGFLHRRGSEERQDRRLP
jgi:hypothetical protein